MAERIRELDGLRAIAVASVVIFHAYGENALAGGYLGVDIFFVISGYIITRILLREHRQTGGISLKGFYLRRMRRIWPALTVLLATVAVVETVRMAISERTFASDTFILALASIAGVMNWIRAFEYSGGGIFGHIWSLAVEEQFYLLWPPLLVFCLRFQNRSATPVIPVIILAILLWRTFLVLSGAPPERTYNGLDTRADALLIGCCFALREGGNPFSATRMAGFGAASCILLAMLAFVSWTSAFMNSAGFTIAALCAAFWVAETASPHRLTTQTLGARPMVWLGLRSYSLYLWHYPVIVWMNMTDLPHGVAMPLAILISLVMADLSYRFVELGVRSRPLPPGA